MLSFRRHLALINLMGGNPGVLEMEVQAERSDVLTRGIIAF